MLFLIFSSLMAGSMFLHLAAAHSWVEQLFVIDSTGMFTGEPGYPRNNTNRTTPGFTDLSMVHILPTAGAPTIETRDTPDPITAVDTMGIGPTDQMCKRTQEQQYQSPDQPRLAASPGSMIALRYQENGHVTLPENQPGKPKNRGTVYIYGTTQPKPNENFLDVFKQWNADGTGGDKRGRLIATQSYDDGRCYQKNGGPIAVSRIAQYTHAASNPMGEDLWCQNDIRIPADAVSGKPYTIYWVWDWPTAPGVDPGLPKGKAEIYTTCIDIDIKAAKKRDTLEIRQAPVSQISDGQLQVPAGGAPTGSAAATGMNLNHAAIPSYVSSMMAAPSAAPPASAPGQAVSQISDGQVQAAVAPSTPPAPSSSAAVSPTVPPSTAVPASQLPLSAIVAQVISQLAIGQSQVAPTTVQVTVTTTATTVIQSPAFSSPSSHTVAAAPVSQISDGQIQAPVGSPSATYSAGGIQQSTSTATVVVTSAVAQTHTVQASASTPPAASSSDTASSASPLSAQANPSAVSMSSAASSSDELDIQPPIFKGTATPVSNPPSASPHSNVPTVVITNVPVTVSSSAAPAPTASGMVASASAASLVKKSCGKCKVVKRSRIMR